jgi:hypothetical protein
MFLMFGLGHIFARDFAYFASAACYHRVGTPTHEHRRRTALAGVRDDQLHSDEPGRGGGNSLSSC